MECFGYARSSGETSRMIPSIPYIPNCLPHPNDGCNLGARSRKPITALAAQGFWNGVSDIKEIFFNSSYGFDDESSSKFYISRYHHDKRDQDANVDQFFEDITTLCQRQTMLFQRSCEQLSDMYNSDLAKGGTLERTFKRSPNFQNTTQPSPNPFGLETSTNDIEKLYQDCLMTILHQIGCDADRDGQWALVEHLRKAFRFDPQRHLEYFDKVTAQPKPSLKIHISILEAKELVIKDISGFNDPFCSFYLKSNPDKVWITDYKAKTLNPVWNEAFSIPLPFDSITDEIVHVDVWNFTPDEKFKAKLKKIQQVSNSILLLLLLN